MDVDTTWALDAQAKQAMAQLAAGDAMMSTMSAGDIKRQESIVVENPWPCGSGQIISGTLPIRHHHLDRLFVLATIGSTTDAGQSPHRPSNGL